MRYSARAEFIMRGIIAGCSRDRNRSSGSACPPRRATHPSRRLAGRTGGSGHRIARSQRVGEDNVAARNRRCPDHRERTGDRARPTRRRARVAATRCLRHPGTIGLRGSDRGGEPALLRPRPRRGARADRGGDRPRRSERADASGRGDAVRRRVLARIAGGRVAWQAGAARARRADRRRRPDPAARDLAHLLRAC